MGYANFSHLILIQKGAVVALVISWVTGSILITIAQDSYNIAVEYFWIKTAISPVRFRTPACQMKVILRISPKVGPHGNVPWDIGIRGPDWSSAPKMLSFGEKFVKIGPAYPEIFGRIHLYLPCRTVNSQMSSVNSGVIGPKFTKLLHDIEVSFMLLMCILT